MQLPRLAIENKQFTLTLTILLVLVGLVSYFTMPRSEDPQFDLPITLIEVVAPGLSPKNIESLIVDPLEQEISDIEHIKRLETQVKNGGARIEVEFFYGTDADLSYNKVKQAVDSIKPSFPAGVQNLLVLKATPTDVAIMQLAISSSPTDYRAMELYAKRLEKQLEAVEGVKKADIWGYPTQIVSIDVDKAKMKQYQLSVAELNQVLMGRASNISPGFIDADTRRFNVRASGDFSSLSQIKNTVVKQTANSAIYVRDVASVSFADLTPNYLAYYHQKPVIFVTVQQSAQTNIFQVTEKLEQTLAEFKQNTPANINIDVLFKQSASVEHRVNGFFINLLQGLLVVAVMSLLFLGWRAAIVVTAAIPMSFLIAIGWLEFAGFGLQQMSIVGLIIALGLLVDNAIVVTESIDVEKRQADNLTAASAKGASKVGWAITSGTATTILAFLPMLLLHSATGDFLRSMPITVVLVLIASLLVALTITPLMASKLFKLHNQRNFKTLQHYCNDFAESVYANILSHLLQYRYWVIAASLVLLVAMFSLFTQVGVSLFPKAEKPMLLVDVEAPTNTTLEQTKQIMQQLEQALLKQPLIDNVALNVGNANPRMYYNEIPRRGVAYYGQALVLLKQYDEPAIAELVSQLRQQFSQWPQAKINVKEFTQGPVTDQAVTIRLFSNELTALTDTAKQLEQFMASQQGLVNIHNPIGKAQTEYHLAIDYDKAALLGLNIHTLDDTLQTLLSGKAIGQFNDDNGENYPIVVRQNNLAVSSLKDIDIVNNQGQLIPLSSVISPQLVAGQADFFHYQKLRMAKVSADVAKGASVNELTKQVAAFLQQAKLPRSVRYELGGEEENRQKSFGGLTQILLITAIGIMAILVLQFKSFLQPLIIFSSIPFAMAGSAIGLYLFDLSFSMMAFIGLISLFGIVVNDAILLVDTTNQNRQAGQALLPAIISAGNTRFTPIILTTLTTIGGLLPLTIWGGHLWQPLGVVIISGMCVAGITSLIIVPLLTLIFTKNK